MTSSRTITLFEPPPPVRTGPSSFVVSVVTHAAVLALMFLAIAHAPRIVYQTRAQRYTVRLLKLRRTEPRIRYSAGSGGAPAATHAVARATRPGGTPSASSAPRLLAQRSPSTETLVQPDAPKDAPLLAEAPIPTVVMWTPENAPTPKIIPPPPQKPTTANVRPSLVRPNLEPKVSDIQLSSTSFTSETLPVSASTTSPISMRVPGATVKVPQTASRPNGQPTPATVMAMSDVLLPEGTVALPSANQTASGSSSQWLAPGRPDSTSDTGVGVAAGNGIAAGKQTGSGAGGSSGGQGGQEEAANGMGGNGSGEIGSGEGSDSGSIAGDPFAVDRLTMPRNGEYGVVVVGASLGDEYPETLGMWAGRLAYTVYLHVGLQKNWILQYSLPRVAKDSSPRVVKADGISARPDAPWPYLIVRPHLLPEDSDSDAIMVHGFINSGGHFEQLAIVFPPQFPQTKFVLGTLQQWEFRPARQNGRQTPVEVLLIIPDQSE